ncbi:MULTISPECIES: acetolactate synthase small subunit [unclassified Colwellia]|jgi:acetolactate synthase-1/3 small subunit|uniref:acetolactate synthase small subunit n=1 Tax=unclassified Colwellia TaxID=196834 RepID=UPI0015F47954|nr:MULTISPECIES: acetolactate synthase small subunit [unclassified Colwellia]MBA6234205.1 acetolactate synthase small subunit [Colwellia sp. MB02u-7]MBA6237808.1 acetolactate synthase small subunit [Colwellia sp. MB02u-11]MBA6254839.1 acetolactate synthase small subunit [Colwellia sp. MB3u-28]MBA6259843.1 acetolactate synthase small subunit [Colwellia sp. MB3u-41]MBA6300941.1 acetolactate synthase small subunit [Colwellia sp. MB3u-22]
MRRILAVLLENEPGSLSRIVGLFSQRAFNIESLTVAPTEDQSLSRITIATRGDDKVLEQIVKQVNKLIDVIKITDLTERSHVERELLLIKVLAMNDKSRTEVKRITDIFRGSIVDIGKQVYTIELTGDAEKLNAFVNTLANETEIIESVRSGCVGIARGEKALRL